MDHAPPRWVSRAEYLTSPVGCATRYERGAAWWPAGTGIRLLRVSGCLDQLDLDFVLAVLAADVASGTPEHDSLVDVRGFEAADETFDALVRWVGAHKSELRERVSKSAVVYSQMVHGALVVGYHRLADVPFQSRMFESGQQALEWLGVASSAGLWKTWEESAALGKLGGDLLARTRREVHSRSGPLHLEQCARALGVSPRSLQRALADEGLSFRQLLIEERVARAKPLLTRGDAKLLSVAMEVGFSKVEQLNQAFLRVEGCTAAGWRERKR